MEGKEVAGRVAIWRSSKTGLGYYLAVIYPNIRRQHCKHMDNKVVALDAGV